jgi:hypothetical protein
MFQGSRLALPEPEEPALLGSVRSAAEEDLLVPIAVEWDAEGECGPYFREENYEALSNP